MLSQRVARVRESFIREILKVIDRPGVISLAGGLPDPTLFPAAELQAASERIFSRSAARALQYGPTQGDADLRAWIAEEYYARRGVKLSAEDILITNGSQQGLDLIGRVLLDADDLVGVERPAYPGALQAFQQFAVRFREFPLTADGIDPEHLHPAGLRDLKLLYACPQFQNPSGALYSAGVRERLVESARAAGALLVEDDPYGELAFAPNGRPALKALHPEGVIALGTFSKTLAPGLRVGWVAPPAALRPAFLKMKQASDLHTSSFAQALIVEFLRSGSRATILERMRRTYADKCAVLAGELEALSARLPGESRLQFTRPQGGMFLWVRLPTDVRASELFSIALERGVAVVPAPAFYAESGADDAVRLNFSYPDRETLREGARRLGVALAELRERNGLAA